MSLSEIEYYVAHGMLREARSKLLPLTKARPPRAELARVASLYRRAWLPEHSIRLLHPVVRPGARRKARVEATPEERLEYATSLILLGAHLEGMSLLEGVDPKLLPEAYFSKALALFRQWDWEGTLPFWAELDSNPRSTDLQRLRSRVYLANALTFGKGDYEASLSECEGIAGEASGTRYRMVHKSRLLLVIQNHALMARPGSARAAYEETRALCEEDSDERFLLHAWLWKSVAEKDLDGIRMARERFKEQRRWEETRECDYYHAVLSRDRDSLTRLYFGTPYPRFRERAAAELGGEDALPRSYGWKLWDGTRLSKLVFDVEAGTNNLSSGVLKRGQALHRCLRALAEDFVMPPSVARLHELVYPGEHFNPHSTPDKMHQLLKRLRRWLKAQRLSLEMRESAGTYRLYSPAGCVLRVWRDPEKAGIVDPALLEAAELLRRRFGSGPFRSVEAAECLRVSWATAKRKLESARKAGLLSRSGMGPGSRYALRT